MRPVVGVVEDREGEPAFEVVLGQGPKQRQLQALLEGPPEALDQGDGTALADGAEAVLDVEPFQELAEAACRELGSPVSDKVTGPAVAAHS